MKEIVNFIKDYFVKKKLKKILKRRLLKMSDKINLKDDEYIINGKVMKDTDVVNEITHWALQNFIFRANDVYLPNIPAPLFGMNNIAKHNDLEVENFTKKYGNVSLKYLLYNAFITGYEAGIARGQNDASDYVDKNIEKIVNESEEKKEVITKKKSSKTKTKNVVEDSLPENKDKVKQKEKEAIAESTKKDIKKKENEKKKNLDIKEETNEENNEKKPFTSYQYDENNRLIVSSNAYAMGSYEKYISMVIEKRIGIYGLQVDDLYNNIQSYILAEVLIDINEADTVDANQEKVKQVFYDYFKNLQETTTKENTTV
jgi:hypothetical protein